jgi:hypothetical protein
MIQPKMKRMIALSPVALPIAVDEIHGAPGPEAKPLAISPSVKTAPAPRNQKSFTRSGRTR